MVCWTLFIRIILVFVSFRFLLPSRTKNKSIVDMLQFLLARPSRRASSIIHNSRRCVSDVSAKLPVTAPSTSAAPNKDFVDLFLFLLHTGLKQACLYYTGTILTDLEVSSIFFFLLVFDVFANLYFDIFLA